MNLQSPYAVVLALSLVAPGVAAAAGWQPSQPIEIVVPAGAGGGADQLAREIARVAEEEHLTSQKINVVNRKGGSGAEGYMYAKGKSGDAHTLVITLSNLFTLPVAMGTPFKWSELTPVARVALDDFVLWVNADTPYKSTKAYLDAVKASPGVEKMGGTGSAQEDQIVTILIEQASGAKFQYVPLGAGGEVAKILADKKIDSTVNNPSEAAELWKQGKLRPLGVARAKRMTIAGWTEIPTLKEQGYDVEYLMMRGLFGPPSMPPEATKYYLELLHKVYKTKPFQEYLKKNALNAAWLAGPEFKNWLEEQDALHVKLLGTVGLK